MVSHKRRSVLEKDKLRLSKFTAPGYQLLPPFSAFRLLILRHILRHPLRRRTIRSWAVLPRISTSTRTTPLHDDRLALRTSANLRLHIRPILDILPEIAHVAADFLVRLQAKRDDGDEAECEPFPGGEVLARCVENWGVGWEGERDEGTYHRFMTRPLKFPQFWHCTVMCSAPESLDVKAER